MTSNCITIIGIFLQLLGAVYLVVQSFLTRKKLQKYREPLTYGTIAPSIEITIQELSGQFSQQLVGFIFVLFGSAFQLYAAAFS